MFSRSYLLPLKIKLKLKIYLLIKKQIHQRNKVSMFKAIDYNDNAVDPTLSFSDYIHESLYNTCLWIIRL